MSVTKNCGDLELGVKINVSVHYSLVATTPEERQRRKEIDDKIADIYHNLTITVADQIADHIGYTQEFVISKISDQDIKNSINREAEDEGRAAKAAIRSGLPAPPPGKIGEKIPAGESLESVEGIDGQPHQE